MNKNDGLVKFQEEYNKIMKALHKSHENERRLMKKCRELRADIVSNSVRVQQAEQITNEDPSNITALKRELDGAWKLVASAADKENLARERIRVLKDEINTLGKIIETGSGGVVGADTYVLYNPKDLILLHSSNKMHKKCRLWEIVGLIRLSV